jgi:hypothetical protein
VAHPERGDVPLPLRRVRQLEVGCLRDRG